MPVENTDSLAGEERNSYLSMDAQNTKVPRTFQTLMTDAELAGKGIMIVPVGKAKSINKWFSSGPEERNASVFHHISWHSPASFRSSAIQRIGVQQSHLWRSVGLNLEVPRTGMHGASVQHTDAQHEQRLLVEKIHARIAEIRESAAEEGEPFSEQSAANTGVFLENLRFTISPSVFLVGNGNLRLVWTNAQREQAAFQIKADQEEAQYVIFRSDGDGGFDQILGSMSFKNVYSFLEGLKLVHGLIGGSITYGEFA